jgi:hypothetical protein
MRQEEEEEVVVVVEEDFSTSMLLSLRTLFEAAYYTEGGCPPFVQ